MMTAPNQYRMELPLLEDAPQQLIRNLSQIQSHQSNCQATPLCPANYYPELNAYSLMKSDSLQIYFIDFNKVIDVQFSSHIEILSARHVFLFAGRPETRIPGFFALAFGKNAWALILINPESPHKCYEIYKLSAYQNIQPDQTLEYVTSALLVGQDLKQSRQGFAEQVVQVLLGVSQQQKVLQVTISLSFKDSLMICPEEVLLYEEPRSFRSRISSFLSSKLGYAAETELDAYKMIHDVHQVGPYVIAVTGKGVLIVERPALVKVFETEYLEATRARISEIEHQDGLRLMRRELQFRLVSSSINYNETQKQLQVNLFLIREQDVQNLDSYETDRTVQIIYQPILLFEDRRQLAEHFERELFSFDLMDRLPPSKDSQLKKSVALNYNYFNEVCGPDVMQVLLLEFSGSKTLMIEHSQQTKLQNVSELRSEQINGFAFESKDEEREQIVNLAIMTEADVDVYSFDPTNSMISQTQPQNPLQSLVYNPAMAAQPKESEYPEGPFEIVPQQLPNLEAFILTTLEKIAQQRKAEAKQRDQDGFSRSLTQQINYDMSRAVSMFSPQAIVETTLKVLKEVMNSELEDKVYQRDYRDEVKNAFSDEGLVAISLENKALKLEIISYFLNSAHLADQESLYFRKLAELTVNREAAVVLKYIQNDIKTGNRMSVDAQGRRKYPLQAHFFTQILQLSAKRMGFDADKIKAKGSTSEYLVYSYIGSFESVIDTILSFAVDKEAKRVLDVDDECLILEIGASIATKIFTSLVEQFKPDQLSASFLNDKNILAKAVRLGERMKELSRKGTVNLRESIINLCESIVNIFIAVDLEDKENWISSLTDVIKGGVDSVQALTFAKRYICRRQVCDLVFELGQDYYGILHQCIEEWQPDFLQMAFAVTYDLEKRTLLERRQLGLLDNKFRGLQIFSMFEDKYYDQFSQFLRNVNPKLLSLLQLRRGEANEANELIKVTLPQLKGVQTIKVVASLAATNVERSVNNLTNQQADAEKTYYNQELERARLQGQVLPEESEIQPISVEYLNYSYQQLRKLRSQDYHRQGNLKKILEIVTYFSLRQEDHRLVDELRAAAWLLVVKEDTNQLKLIQQALSGSSQDIGVQNLVRGSLTHSLAQDDDLPPLQTWIQEQLETQVSPDAVLGLKTVFSFLNSVADATNFSQRHSLGLTINASRHEEDEVMT